VSNNRFQFEGLDELREALRALPQELAGEASHIIEASKNGAEADIKAAYPDRTGDLRDHLTSSLETSGVAVVGVVKNTSKLAWIFENGTQARHNALGANRGSMPAGHVFIPVIIRYRRQMYENLKALLVRKGLLVSGDA
jgi:hypothetical protein